MPIDLTYPTNLNKFRKRRNEKKYLFPLMATLPSHFPSLSSFTSMLCVGPGPGEYELQLIQQCLPSLKKFVGVEQDEYCRNELEKNLKEKFGKRFEYEIVKESMETWQATQRFDLVMASHCLYNVEKEDRKKLFKKVLNDWLSEKGLFLLVSMSNKYENGKSLNVMQNIHTLLQKHMGKLVEAEEVLQETEEVGAETLFAQRFFCFFLIHTCFACFLYSFFTYQPTLLLWQVHLIRTTFFFVYSSRNTSTTHNNIRNTFNNFRNHLTTYNNIRNTLTTYNNIRNTLTTYNNIRNTLTTYNNIRNTLTTYNNIRNTLTTYNNIRNTLTTYNNIRNTLTTYNNIRNTLTTYNNIRNTLTTYNNIRNTLTTYNNIRNTLTTYNNIRNTLTTYNNIRNTLTTYNNIRNTLNNI